MFIICTLFFISVQCKSWCICFELSYYFFLVLLIFEEDLWLETHHRMPLWPRKMFEVFVCTRKPLIELRRFRFKLITFAGIISALITFSSTLSLNFSYNILGRRYLGNDNIGVNRYIIFKFFSTHFQIFKIVYYFFISDLLLLRNI